QQTLEIRFGKAVLPPDHHRGGAHEAVGDPAVLVLELPHRYPLRTAELTATVGGKGCGHPLRLRRWPGRDGSRDNADSVAHPDPMTHEEAAVDLDGADVWGGGTVQGARVGPAGFHVEHGHDPAVPIPEGDRKRDECVLHPEGLVGRAREEEGYPRVRGEGAPAHQSHAARLRC